MKFGMAVLSGVVLSSVMVWAARASAEPPTMADVHRLGELIELEDAQLYIPHAASATNGTIDVVVHFHGGLAYMARDIEQYGFNTVLIYFSPGGFSSAYRVPFEDEKRFERLLDEAKDELREQERWAEDVDWDDVVVTSFSAGYGAVRELLKSPRYVREIDGVLLCDSLYAGYVGEPAERRVNPQQMKPFVDFAKRAARGKKYFTFTHSYIVPPGYAGTHETADYLAEALGLAWQGLDLDGPGGMHRDRTASRKNFTLVGGTGDDAIAHMIHLHEAGFFLEQMGLLDPVAEPMETEVVVPGERD